MSSRVFLFITLVVVAATAAAAILLLKPAVDEARAAQQERVVLQQRISREEELAKAFEDLAQDIEAYREGVEQAEFALPTVDERRSDIPALLVTIEELAEREARGVFLQGVKVEEGLRSEGGPAVSKAGAAGGAPPYAVAYREVSVNGIASYESLKRFLNAASQSLRLFEPQALSFGITPEGDVASFSLTLRSLLQLP